MCSLPVYIRLSPWSVCGVQVNVSGHRIGTAEVEAALTEHPACVEAAVIGVDHAIKGQGIYA